ncbi:cytochrome P450 [Nocardia sp. CA-151230]|uniref:cytochrome P450 n=1 Tax=Nocardia sp. CA-151230 TaxID=3239982 RepID=UPI003D8FAAC4
MLTSARHLLGRDPGAQALVREEPVQCPVPSPTADDIAALTYTTMVVTEAARLYPPATYIARWARRGPARSAAVGCRQAPMSPGRRG